LPPLSLKEVSPFSIVSSHIPEMGPLPHVQKTHFACPRCPTPQQHEGITPFKSRVIFFIFFAMATVLESKRVIQSKDTKLFLKPNGKWTDKVDDAAHFRSFAEVFSTCDSLSLEGVQLVLKFKQSQYDTRVDFSI
jgi:hypothetical protein